MTAVITSAAAKAIRQFRRNEFIVTPSFRRGQEYGGEIVGIGIGIGDIPAPLTYPL